MRKMENNSLYMLYKLLATYGGVMNVTFCCKSFEFRTRYSCDVILYGQVKQTYERFVKTSEDLFRITPEELWQTVMFKYINGVGNECRVYFNAANKPTGDGNPQNKKVRYPWDLGHSNGEYHGDEPTEEEIDFINGQGG